MKKLMKYFKEEEGLVAIEYALIATLVALAIVGTVTLLGTTLSGIFQAIVDALS